MDASNDKLMLGRWLYGTNPYKPLEYVISETEDGQLRFLGPHSAGSKVTGVLQPEGQWMQTELVDRNDTAVGHIRLRLEHGNCISNFKSLSKNDWGKDIIAERPPPTGSRPAQYGPAACREELSLVAECTGWLPEKEEVHFRQCWCEKKTVRHELVVRLGKLDEEGGGQKNSLKDLFVSLSFQVISATQLWKWRLFPANAPAEGPQQWSAENILVPRGPEDVKVKRGGDEGHGRLFHIIERRGTKVTICIELELKENASSPIARVWYEPRGLGKPIVCQDGRGAMTDQVALAYKLRGVDFDEIWNDAVRELAPRATLMVCDQALATGDPEAEARPPNCGAVSEAPAACREPLCMVGDFNGWSPDVPQYHFKQLWFDRQTGAVRQELCFWIGEESMPHARDWTQVFASLSFQIISAAPSHTWEFRLYPALEPKGSSWGPENVLVPGKKEAVVVAHGGSAGHGKNFFLCERYGTTITICVELYIPKGRSHTALKPHVWYEHRGKDAQANGKDSSNPGKINVGKAMKFRGLHPHAEWDSGLVEALAPPWKKRHEAYKKAQGKNAPVPMKLPKEKQISKEKLLDEYDRMISLFSDRRVQELLVDSARLTLVPADFDDNYLYTTPEVREVMDGYVEGMFRRLSLEDWHEFRAAFTPYPDDPEFGRKHALLMDSLRKAVDVAKKNPKPKEKPAAAKPQDAIMIRDEKNSAIVASCGTRLEVGDEVMIQWHPRTEGARYMTYLNGHVAKLVSFDESEKKWRVSLVTHSGDFNIHANSLRKVTAPPAGTGTAKKKKAAARPTDCQMCSENFLESQLVHLECKQGHHYCHDCLRKWCRSKLVPRCYYCLEESSNLQWGDGEPWMCHVIDEERAIDIYRISSKDLDKVGCICEFRVASGAEVIIIGVNKISGWRGTVGRVTKNPTGFSAVVYVHKNSEEYELGTTNLSVDDCLSSGRLAAGKPCPAKDSTRFGQSLQVASLGCACPVKQAMDELDVLQLAMPFDWLVTRVEGVLYFFRHRFRDFCHYDDKCVVGSHGFTSFRSGYHAFPHHDLNAGGAIGAFLRRAYRLYQLVRSPAEDAGARPVLLVRICASSREFDRSEELYALLRLVGGQRIFLLVVLTEQDPRFHGAAQHLIHRNLIFWFTGHGGADLPDMIKFGMDYAYGIMLRGEVSLKKVARKVSFVSPVSRAATIQKEASFHAHWLARDKRGLMPTSEISDVAGSDYDYPHDFFPGKFHKNKFEASPYYSRQLEEAVLKGRLADVRKLASSQDVDVNAWDIKGETVLFRAAARGKVHVIAILMLSAADPNCRDLSGKRPVSHLPAADKHAQAQLWAARKIMLACQGSDVSTVDLSKAINEVPEPERRQLYSRLGVMTVPERAEQKARVATIPKSAQGLFTPHMLADAEARGDDFVEALLCLRKEAGADANRRRLIMRKLLRDWHPDKHSRSTAEAQEHAESVFCYIQGLRSLFLGQDDEKSNRRSSTERT